MSKSLFFFFIPLMILVFGTGNVLVTADEIMIPREDVNVSSPTQVQAIVLDSNGNMTEQEYTYDPDTQVIVIDSDNGGENASIFFPLFATGFIWWNGYWVNREGYYYSNNRWVHVDDRDWNGHWHGYWNNHWDNHWHNHWNNRRGDADFRYRNQEHWKGNSFQGRHGAGGRGSNHGGGAREHGGGGRGGGGHR